MPTHTYVVSYDLHKPQQDYAGLIEALKGYETWWHHLGSTWLIVTDDSATQVRDNLGQHLDSNDELLVVESSHVGAWKGFNQRGSEWLTSNL